MAKDSRRKDCNVFEWAYALSPLRAKIYAMWPRALLEVGTISQRNLLRRLTSSGTGIVLLAPIPWIDRIWY